MTRFNMELQDKIRDLHKAFNGDRMLIVYELHVLFDWNWDECMQATEFLFPND